jgi:hypothetical protein
MKTTFSFVLMAAVAGSVLLTFSGCDSEEPVDPAKQVSAHTFSISNWNYASPEHYADLPVAAITSANINSVGVMVYYSAYPDVWVSVPYTVYGTVHDYHMGFLYDPGTVEVTWMYDGTSMGSDPNTYYGTTVKCKVVVVPSTARLANPNLDWNDYEQVKRRFHLKD